MYPCFGKLNIIKDIMKPLGIVTGEDLRDRIKESLEISNVAADKFRMTPIKESKEETSGESKFEEIEDESFEI